MESGRISREVTQLDLMTECNLKGFTRRRKQGNKAIAQREDGCSRRDTVATPFMKWQEIKI